MSSAVIARVVVLKSSGRDGGVLPITEQTLRDTDGHISFGRKVENTVRINKPCVSRCHSAIFFQKRADGCFGATLKTVSKTNPTLVNDDAHVHRGDADWVLRHDDIITIGDRSFRFEFVGAGDRAGSENKNSSNVKPARFGSARKQKPKSAKKKRALPTPVREAIGSRRIATPKVIMVSAPSPAAAALSVKKNRALPTPVRKAIANRFGFVATTGATPAKAAPLSSKKSAKKVKKRALPTPVRKAISSRRVATPAAPHVTEEAAPLSAKKSAKKVKKRALPTPVRKAISSRRVAKSAAKKAKSAAKKSRRLATPIRAQINSRRMATPKVSVSSGALAASLWPEEFATKSATPEAANTAVLAGTPFLLYSGGDGNFENVEGESHSIQEQQEEEQEDSEYEAYDCYTEEISAPAVDAIKFEGKKTTFDTPSPHSREDIRYNVHWTYDDYLKEKKKATPEAANFAGLSEMMRTPNEPKERFPAAGDSLRSVGKSPLRLQSSGKSLKSRKAFLPTPIRVAISKRRIATPVNRAVTAGPSDVEENTLVEQAIEQEDDKEEDVEMEDAEQIHEESLRALPTPLRTAIAARRIATPLPVPPANASQEVEESDEVVQEVPVKKAAADPVITKLSQDAPVEEAPVEEAPVEEAPVEEVATAPIITKLSQVKRTTPTDMKKMKVHALMEALSKDDEDGTYDWFNCIVVGKYKKGKGVQIQWVDADGVTPVGSKEWTTRIHARIGAEGEAAVVADMVVSKEIKDSAHFSSLRVVDLKEELIKLELSTKGRKADLVKRLVAHFA
jgi:hypothetical protein